MNTKQEAHLNWLLDAVDSKLEKKYVAGTKEHRGCLADKSAEYLIDQAIDEAIDQITYLLTLKSKIPHEQAKRKTAGPKSK